MTAIRCKYGTFQFSVKPFGMMDASAVLQEMEEALFRDLGLVFGYIDDVMIRSQNL